MDYGDFNGTQNAASMMDAFGVLTDSAAALNACVFLTKYLVVTWPATNGLNREQFDANTTQLNLTYQLNDNIELKCIRV